MTSEAPTQNPKTAVMIHGAGGGGWEYNLWRPVFERARWNVVAPDLLPATAGLLTTTFDDYLAQVVSWAPRRRGLLAVIGASLGGILALRATETLRPDAIVLVNSVPPKQRLHRSSRPMPYPEIVRWADRPITETRQAMPDSDTEMIGYAHARWRDESGAVLNEVRRGIVVAKPVCSTLVVVGSEDVDIAPSTGLRIAAWAGADVHVYNETSHVGPLLGRRATEIAEATLMWIEARVTACGTG